MISSVHLRLCKHQNIWLLGPKTDFNFLSVLFSIQSFQSRHGKAYLFNKVSNVTLGEKEERLMITGAHTVADLYCVQCGSIVGWKYEMAHEKSQKYKEGKSVLERFKMSGPDGSNYWGNHEAHAVGGSDTDDV
ncbi:protein yippee-like [Salvia hispanica]|uniref:protein yippee-like n=1 Tax=Salvia hispanica TaxID=49212 RepID=UPI002009A84A|nr:protein yippee-like [Salvia hispanica]